MIASRSYGGNGSGRNGERKDGTPQLSNLFTGIAKCGKCGGSMYLAQMSIKQRKYGWLRCTNAVRENKCNNRASVSYPKLEASVVGDVAWHQKVQRNIPRHNPSEELAERIAEKEAETKRIDTTLSALTDTFGSNPLPAIAAQIKERAEHHAVLQGEIEQLRQSYQIALSNAEQPDRLTERDRLLAEAASTDPVKRYEARSRIAAAIRETVRTITCLPDRTVQLTYRSIETVAGVTPQKIHVDASIITITNRMVMHREADDGWTTDDLLRPRRQRSVKDKAPRTVTFQTVFDANFSARKLMIVNRPKMTLDITDVDPNDPMQVLGD
jgi:hypothetical protein